MPRKTRGAVAVVVADDAANQESDVGAKLDALVEELDVEGLAHSP
jgi:hypothetical protein